MHRIRVRLFLQVDRQNRGTSMMRTHFVTKAQMRNIMERTFCLQQRGLGCPFWTSVTRLMSC